MPLKAQPPSGESHLKERAWRPGVDESRKSALRAYLASLALVGLVTILGSWITLIVERPNLVILYMLAVVFTAMRWGRQAAILSEVSSAHLFDYFFVLPYQSFGSPTRGI
jgi:K+-sensing histidine kinase KdpD